MFMNRVCRLSGLVFLAFCPQLVKRLCFIYLYKFDIGTNTQIGIVLIDCQQFKLGDNSRISSGTIFWKCKSVCIGKQVNIGVFNLFRGGVRVFIDDYCELLRLNVLNAIDHTSFKTEPNSTFELGYGSVITAEHRIDFTDKVKIGKNTILGGRNSSIWTHNRRQGNGVTIGDYCYIGSEVRFAPGSSIPSKCIVGIGSVIVDSFIAEGQLIAGVPGRHIRWINDRDCELLFDKTRLDLPEQLL